MQPWQATREHAKTFKIMLAMPAKHLVFTLDLDTISQKKSFFPIVSTV